MVNAAATLANLLLTCCHSDRSEGKAEMKLAMRKCHFSWFLLDTHIHTHVLVREIYIRMGLAVFFVFHFISRFLRFAPDKLFGIAGLILTVHNYSTKANYIWVHTYTHSTKLSGYRRCLLSNWEDLWTGNAKQNAKSHLKVSFLTYKT